MFTSPNIKTARRCFSHKFINVKNTLYCSQIPNIIEILIHFAGWHPNVGFVKLGIQGDQDRPQEDIEEWELAEQKLLVRNEM
jgi:hypothetical protein